MHDVEQARAATVFPLHAPVGGRILRVVQTSEAVVPLGAPLLEIGDPGRLEVVAELLTADATLARPGSLVHIDRWGGAPLTGRVRRVEPAASTKISALGVEQQRVRAIIDLADTAAADGLGVGYRVNVRIVTSRHERVLKVPVSAVFPLPGTVGTQAGVMGVYQVRDGRARLTAVRLGARNDAAAWVQAGLEQGAQVIVYPSAEVRDGARVRVRSVAQPH